MSKKYILQKSKKTQRRKRKSENKKTQKAGTKDEDMVELKRIWKNIPEEKKTKTSSKPKSNSLMILEDNVWKYDDNENLDLSQLDIDNSSLKVSAKEFKPLSVDAQEYVPPTVLEPPISLSPLSTRPTFSIDPYYYYVNNPPPSPSYIIQMSEKFMKEGFQKNILGVNGRMKNLYFSVTKNTSLIVLNLDNLKFYGPLYANGSIQSQLIPGSFENKFEYHIPIKPFDKSTIINNPMFDASRQITGKRRGKPNPGLWTHWWKTDKLSRKKHLKMKNRDSYEKRLKNKGKN